MRTKQSTLLENLQQEVVGELRKESILWTIQMGWKINIETLEQFLNTSIQKSYEVGYEKGAKDEKKFGKLYFKNLKLKEKQK